MDAEINASISEIHTRSHKPIEGISECVIMKDTVRMAAITLIANVSSCVNDIMDRGETYVTDIYARGKLAVEKIKEIKDESSECFKDVSGIGQITTAIGCVAKASAKGTLVVGQTVPVLSVDFAKLIFEISTLQATLPLCMQANALLTLAQEAEGIVVAIKDCIKEKLEDGSTGEGSEETGEQYTEAQINEEQSSNEVVDEHHQVQHQPNSEDESTNEHHALIEVHE